MARLLFGQFYWVWIVGFFSTASLLSWISISQILDLYKKRTYKAAKIVGSKASHSKKLSTRIILTGRNIFDPNGGMVEGTKKVKKKKKVDEPKKPVAKSTVPGCPPILPGVKIPESKVRTVRLKGTSYVEMDPSQSVAAVFVKVKNQPSSAPPPPPPPRRRLTKIRGRRGRRAITRRIQPRRRYYRRSGGKWRWTTEIFRVGELMMEKMRICMIGPKEIVFYHQGKLQKFSLELKKKKRQLRYYGSLGIAKPKDDTDGPGQVRIDAIDKRTISRKTVQDWLQNPMAHATSARIMPVRTGGLRLVWVRQKSLYSQLGLKTGDTVLSVNGKKLNVANALGLYSQLPYAKMLKVNVIRRGVRRQLQFQVK